MDPTNLIPGLAQVLEERLGRAGRHLGTATVVMVAASLMMLPFVLLAGIVYSASQVFSVTWNPDARTLFHALYWVALALNYGLLYVVYGLCFRPLWRRLREVEDKAKRILEDAELAQGEATEILEEAIRVRDEAMQVRDEIARN